MRLRLVSRSIPFPLFPMPEVNFGVLNLSLSEALSKRFSVRLLLRPPFLFGFSLFWPLHAAAPALTPCRTALLARQTLSDQSLRRSPPLSARAWSSQFNYHSSLFCLGRTPQGARNPHLHESLFFRASLSLLFCSHPPPSYPLS